MKTIADKRNDYAYRVASVLNQLRTQRKITVKCIAKKLYITTADYEDYESGVAIPDLFTLSRIADAFRIETVTLVKIIEKTEITNSHE